MPNQLLTCIQQLLQYNIDEVELLNKLNEIVVNEKLMQRHYSETISVKDLYIEHKNRFLTDDKNPDLIKTGFKYFDKYFGDFSSGEYIVFGARPGNYLEMYLLQIVCSISKQVPVLYISLIDNYEPLITSVVSILTKITPDMLLHGQLSDKQKEILNTFEKKFSLHKLYINKAAGYSISELRVLCVQHMEETPTKVIVFDSLKLITPGFRTQNSRELEDNYIHCELKRMAKDLGVCIIAGCKLRNTFETSISFDGDIRDLFESGTIELEADKIFFLHRPERYGINEDECGTSFVRKIIVMSLKSGYGTLGGIYLQFNENKTAIVDTDYEFPFEYYSDNKAGS